MNESSGFSAVTTLLTEPTGKGGPQCSPKRRPSATSIDHKSDMIRLSTDTKAEIGGLSYDTMRICK
jgi:hypothetical protein